MSATFLVPDSKDFSPDFKEVARYLGYSRTVSPDQDVSGLMEKAADEMAAIMKPQAVFEVFDLTVGLESELSFADVSLHSRDLSRNLAGCSKVALLAATLGPQVDALIRRHSSTDPVYASILQATGPMYIEELVDLVNEEIKKNRRKSGTEKETSLQSGLRRCISESPEGFFSVCFPAPESALP